MQGVLAKSSISAPGAFNLRSSSRFSARSEVATSLPFSLNSTFPRVKLNGAALAFHAHALSTPVINKSKTNTLVFASSAPERRGSSIPRASKKSPQENEKPKWWLRSLAGLPYLLPFLDQLSWTLAHPSNPSPFLENFDNFTFPLLSTILALPRFILATYPVLLYFWIVRRKEWPHFIRFHVMMGILMGAAVQIIGVSSSWFPSWSYPPHFWSAATFLFLVTILECIRCALFGRYSSFPFVKDAALLHSDLNLR